ncbi:hypothetical protein B0G75_103680 [Paraburkholderia sp. BL18I3N2]|nr:hypothetical protein B0G75_103680 [Paraburkholderia sp. BL18I3N2]
MSDADETTRKLPLSGSSAMSLQTDVAVYLGNCAGSSLLIACEGTTIEPGGSTWQRALDALAFPSPRGPYPVSNRFTVFVHETFPNSSADTRVLATYRIDVTCGQSAARARVRSMRSCVDLNAVRFHIGDDVVEVTRAIFRAAQ